MNLNFSERNLRDGSPDPDTCLRAAIDADPLNAPLHNNLGNLLLVRGRFDEAEAAYRRALALREDFAEAHGNLGGLMHTLKRDAEAESAYRKALALRADLPDTLLNLSTLLHGKGRLGEAEETYRRLLTIRPDSIHAQLGLADVLNMQDCYDEAMALCNGAMTSFPALADVHFTLATVFENQERFADAEHAYRRALAIAPDHQRARFNLALVLLRTCRFGEAWDQYESRHELTMPNAQPLPHGVRCPRWRGEPLHGKSILVCEEQGLGDTLQFGRYLTLLKDAGARRLVLACRPALHRLLRGVDGISEVIDSSASTDEPFDFVTFLLDIPRHVDPRAIPDANWLRADCGIVEEWRGRLASLAGFRVGLAWKGNPHHPHDRYRSLPELSALAPLWAVPGVSFISLQKGPGEHEASLLSTSLPIYDAAPHVHDFSDTAAIVAQMDLIVTVDTSVAHLAGALGKPCWVLLNRPRTDWRWTQDSDATPWYPADATRLFRQSRPADWHSAIERVVEALSGASRMPFDEHFIR
ncbi:TPR repeat-containing protein [Burkholderia sp. YI23]|nr:TPR repeat-containing protein [Burkholderia sp. YI23]